MTKMNDAVEITEGTLDAVHAGGYSDVKRVAIKIGSNPTFEKHDLTKYREEFGVELGKDDLVSYREEFGVE